jgi:hypothetical protein
MTDKNWPAWYNGPNGEAEIFRAATEVPAGWTTGAEKRLPSGDKVASKAKQPEPAAAAAATPTDTLNGDAPAAADDDVDAQGWPWSADLHASTKAKTKDGLWRMKVGVTRPAPKPLDL